MATRESKEDRKIRQWNELKTFIEVLRRAGNIVDEEVKFHPDRKWRIDLTIEGPDKCRPYGTLLGDSGRIAIEIEGRGRHQSFYGYSADMEKYNEVTIAGYRLLRVTRDMIGNGDALEILSRAGVNVEPMRVDSSAMQACLDETRKG